MRVWRRIAVALVALVVSSSVCGWALLRASRADRSGTVELAGVRAPVVISFDSRARPYVHAESIEDAFFAEGFLHARERLWQMELLSRVGSGRLAQLLGSSLLETDRELWRHGVPQLAERLRAHAGATTRSRIDHYVAGVNAALDELSIRPPELLLLGVPVRRWQPADVYALGAAMAFSSARNADNELLRWAIAGAVTAEELAAFVPGDLPPDTSVASAGATRSALRALAAREVLDPAQQILLASLSLGSNGWAVAPARSRSGAALFAFDSHDALALPNLYYEVHLFFGGRSIRGWSVPGMPGVINGFNERMAWGFTNIGDSQDLFLETRHPEDPEQFLGPEGWYSARAEEVAIPVRGAPTESLRILHTRHGPLLQDDPPLSLSWAAHRSGELGLDALFELNLAGDWESTSAALDRLAAPSANATYADVEGRIAVRTVGLLPKRGRGQGLLPLPGHEAGVAWKGMIEMGRLPRRVDPASGFVASANVPLAPGSEPLVSADNAAGYRIERIRDVLRGDDHHTLASMSALQMDWRNGQADRVLGPLLRALGDEPLAALPEAARRLLEVWQQDPQNLPAAPAPLVFLHWYLALAENVFAERLGPELWPRVLRNNYLLNHALDGLILAETSDSTWWRGDRTGTIRRAFVQACETLQRERGAVLETWRWDSGHRVRLRHELSSAVPLLGFWLDRGPYPWGGDHATVGRARYRYDRPEEVRSGATVRVVIEMREPMAVRAILPGGQAGHPSDPHYADQIAPWLRGEQDVLGSDPSAGGGSTLRLVPAGVRPAEARGSE